MADWGDLPENKVRPSQGTQLNEDNRMNADNDFNPYCHLSRTTADLGCLNE